MLETIKPYKIIPIQVDKAKTSDLFDKCFIYKFFTDEQTKGGRVRYIARAELYGDCFAIKFYPQSADEDYRYCMCSNRFSFIGVLRIMLTCAYLIPTLIQNYPTASFVIKASESVDLQTKTEEQEDNNQRFRIYKYTISQIIGNETFEHYEYPNVSLYLLVNRKDCCNIEEKKNCIKDKLIDLFNLIEL